MNASKHYSTRSLKASDEAEIAAVLVKHPTWKLKHARELVARLKFMRKIGAMK